ncbi:MAG: ribulokinase [Candidatus Sumerlaeaceae bacterium]|nr:ribulokinase [Candidatus Sumerlaeaceae bacterium]
MSTRYALGIDYGTNTVRALVADCADGREVGSGVAPYPHGETGVVLDPRNPDLARQHPADYLTALPDAVRAALEAAAAADPGFAPSQIVGLGVDATGSTPMPTDEQGCALTDRSEFARHPAAMAWLWKDHTSHAEAREITALAAEIRPQYLGRCGGVYSSEWFWAKALRCLREAPEVFEAAATWVEISDWIPAVLTGTQAPASMRRNLCAAGHKGLFHESWGGYPDAEFLARLDPRLARIRASLPDQCFSIAHTAGRLTAEWAARLGLPAGIPVAVGALDAHLGAVGSGIAPGTLVKILGTSTCDIMVAPLSQDLPLIPGLCGIVPETVLPGHHGLEAGQSAVGDIFNWFVGVVRPGGGMDHGALTAEAACVEPGASGLLALDWHNGNRTVLVDQRLSGLLVGMSLQTTPAEIYRALIEATAFGARVIIERLEEYGVRVDRVVNCGGISTKNRLLLQIYADVLGRPMLVAGSQQTCALGAAIAGAVAGGAHPDFQAAVTAMTRLQPEAFEPDAGRAAVYERLFALYRRLHDAFGVRDSDGTALDGVMKELLDIRDRVRAGQRM